MLQLPKYTTLGAPLQQLLNIAAERFDAIAAQAGNSSGIWRILFPHTEGGLGTIVDDGLRTVLTVRVPEFTVLVVILTEEVLGS
jgi:hypothetical protein